MSSNSERSFDVAACRAHLQARQKQQHRARERRREAALKAMRAAIHAVSPRFPGVRRVYLFGSVLRPGVWRSSSDTDVAVEGRLNAQEYFAFWRELEQAAPDWLVDLVELDRDLRFATLVRERGELIYGCSSPDAESGH